MKTDTPQAVRLSDYRAPDYRILGIDLHFSLDAEKTRVKAHLSLEATGDDAGALMLDGEALTLVSIAIDGVPLAADAYAVGETALTVHRPPRKFILETEVEISPAGNSALSGLYVAGDLLCTQCEAEGFRRITYFLDRPDVMTTYRARIEADKARYPVLLANGNLIAGGELPGGRHFAVWEDPFKKPSYLFALVAGRLGHIEDHFITQSGRKVTLRIFVEPGNEDRCAYAMDSLKRAMRWDEEKYGREYDLDIFMIVAVGAFNFGAMENKGLNIFNDKLILARAETATDTDFANIEAVVAHEYFHNWTGNRITCRNWFQLCLKEGFTVLRDQQFSADMRSEANKRIEDVKLLRMRQFAEDAGPLAHPVRPEAYIEIDNFYTATVYEKGAEVCRMLHTLLGHEIFRNGTDLYFERHDGEATTIEAFAKCFEDAAGVDLTQFRLWWGQSGTPEVDAEYAYDAATKSFTLMLAQSCPPTPGQPTKKPFHIPLTVALVAPNGHDLPLRLEGETAARGTSRVLELRETTQTFRFVDVPVAPTPSLNRNFSAPVKVKVRLASEQRAFLMGRDHDLFNRWDAGQQYAIAHLLALAEASAEKKALKADPLFVEAIGHILDDAERDRAFTALALTLPGEGELALETEPVDPQALHAARVYLTKAIGKAHEARFRELYHRLASNEPFSPDAESAGRRALRNVCLRYIAAAGSADAVKLVHEHYRTANNMTDAAAGLSILSHIETPERQAAFEHFYETWKHDPLITDKWLNMQAMSSLEDTIERVRELRSHPAFSRANPNRFRALVGAFATGNPLRFHAEDGSGYRFVADEVLAMDKVNPQVAARVMGAFESWRRYTPDRQAKMRAELERVAKTEGLSKNVYEIATKTLGA